LDRFLLWLGGFSAIVVTGAEESGSEWRGGGTVVLEFGIRTEQGDQNFLFFPSLFHDICSKELSFM
jgi:hypothetical protein